MAVSILMFGTLLYGVSTSPSPYSIPKPVFCAGFHKPSIDGHAPECFHATTLPLESRPAFIVCALAVW
jgi:hypothetical protein